MNKTVLAQAIASSWSRETCYEPYQEQWTMEHPSYGQCFVTALVVQDHLGGEIVKAKDENNVSHYWNRVHNKDIDLTRDQYPSGAKFSSEQTVQRKDLTENSRYHLLAKIVAFSLLN